MQRTSHFFYYFLIPLYISCAEKDNPEDFTKATSPTKPLPSSVAYTPDPVTKQPKGQITPTVSPRIHPGFGIVVDTSFIWWKAYVSESDYGQLEGRVLSPNFSYEPGFKVGLGMDLYHDSWDVYAQYTWLHEPNLSQANTSITPGSSNYTPSYTQSSSQQTLSALSITSARSIRSSQFNILDADMGRNFYISKRLTLRPAIGIKGASIFEENTVTYVANEISQTASTQWKQNLSGLGLKGSLDTLWHITESFGFYGNMALSTLYSTLHNTYSNNYKSGSGVSKDSLYKNTGLIVPVLELAVGLSYKIWFKENRYEFHMSGGWNQQVWIGYNQNLVTGTTSAGGSLSLQGMTLTAGFIF